MITQRPVSESVIQSQNEADFARDRRAAGARIIEKNGQFWWETHRGFYQALHWLTRMPIDKAVQPSAFCWAYRTSLAEKDAGAANGAIPLNLLQDISGYDIGYLNSKCRNRLRKSRESVTVVELVGPSLLEAEGFEVLRSAWKRTGYAYWAPTGSSFMPSSKAYQENIFRTYTTQSIRLAGIIKGKLGGYFEGYAIGPTAYMHNMVIATEYLSTQIGTAIVFDFVQICRRSGGIREVVYGQHQREDPKLVAFKEQIGFPLVRIPTVVHVNPVVGAILRRRCPDFYYRLTGRE